MSIVYPLDVNRIIADNHRFQKQLAIAQDKYKKALQQLEHIFQTNHQLKKQRDSLEQQKHEELENVINSHKSIYEKQLNNLREEKHQLLTRLQALSEQQIKDNNLQTTIEQLRQEIENHQFEKNIVQQNYEQLKILLESPQKIPHVEEIKSKSNRELLEANRQILELQTRLKEMESKNIISVGELETKKTKISQLQAIIQKMQHTVIDEKERYLQVRAEQDQFIKKLPEDMVSQISQLRKENAILKGKKEEAVLQQVHQDDELLTLLRQFHQELALLRLELIQTKQKREKSLVENYNQRAQNHLKAIKFQKENQLLRLQNIEIKQRFRQTQRSLNLKRKDDSLVLKLQEEISVLKIKLFVFESSKIGQKYRRNKQNQFKQFQDKLKSYLGGVYLQRWRVDILQSIMELSSIIKDMNSKLVEVETNKKSNQKKYRHYKQKYNALNKSLKENSQESSQLLKNYKLKINDYNKLIERLQYQLEKAYSANADYKPNMQLLFSPFEQQMELTNSQNIIMKNQIKQYDLLLRQEKDKYQQQISHLINELNRAKQQNLQLSKKNRLSQNQLLEQSLNINKSRINRDYQAEVNQKNKIIISLQSQIEKNQREYQMQIEERKNNQKILKAQQEKELTHQRNQTAEALLRSNIASQHNSQIIQMKEKLASFQKMLALLGNDDKNNYIINLSTEINQLKEQLLHSKNKNEHMLNYSEKDVESYQLRLMELQDALKIMSHQIEDRNVQNYNLNSENTALSKQIDVLQEQLNSIRGQASSLRQIQIIQNNNQLQLACDQLKQEIQILKQSLEKKNSEIQIIRKESDNLYEQNFKFLLTIKENHLQTKQNIYITQKYQNQRNSKITQFQNKITNLTNQNSILKDLIEQLRAKLLQTKQERGSNVGEHSQAENLRIQLAKNQKQLIYFRGQYQKIYQQRFREKEMFQMEWNKLVNELNYLRNQIQHQEHQNQLNSQASPSQNNPSQNNPSQNNSNQNSQINKILIDQQIQSDTNITFEHQLVSIDSQIQLYENKIIQLNGVINEKLAIIDHLENQNYNLKFEQQRSGASASEIRDLREQIHGLMEIKYKNQDKLRNLEQENSLLQIKRISLNYHEDQNKKQANQIFSQQTFGPTTPILNNRASLINQLRIQDPNQDIKKQLRESQNYILELNSRFAEESSLQHKYEDCLMLLVLSWNQIQTLRLRVTQLEEETQINFSRYAECLKQIQSRQYISNGQDANVSLIQNVECSHWHMMTLTGQSQASTVNAPKFNLNKLGTLVQSVSGNTLLESYSITVGDNQLNSEQLIGL